MPYYYLIAAVEDWQDRQGGEGGPGRRAAGGPRPARPGRG